MSYDDLPQFHLAKGTKGDKFAEKLSLKIGSWAFFFLMNALTAVWIFVNSPSLLHIWKLNPFDPFPYVFLGIIIGIVTMDADFIILITQNRQQEIQYQNLKYIRHLLQMDAQLAIKSIESYSFLTKAVYELQKSVDASATVLKHLAEKHGLPVREIEHNDDPNPDYHQYRPTDPGAPDT